MTAQDDVLQMFFDVRETAVLLKTSDKAVYLMIERGLLPGVTRIGRRVLLRRTAVLDWLDQKCAPSTLEESRR